MARATRNTDTDLDDLKRHLREKADRYSFYQAVRLLRLIDANRDGEIECPADSLWERVRIRPFLGLAFPQSDISDIAWDDAEDRPQVNVHFFGLYGPSSPLPTFYTEDLIELANNDQNGLRDFLDIFHGALYPLLYGAWEKNKLSVRAYEKGESRSIDRLHVFTGLFDPDFRRNDPLALTTLRYAGILTQMPRSAKGLESILYDVLGGIPVAIRQCTERRVPIPKEQRMCLGADLALGEQTVIGEEIDDRMGQIRIRIGPMENEAFDRLLPGGEDFRKVNFWFRFYLIDPVLADIELVLSDRCPSPVTLGTPQRGRLGLDSWLETEPFSSAKSVRFSLQSETLEPVAELLEIPA